MAFCFHRIVFPINGASRDRCVITYLIKEGAVETRKETLKQLMKELDDLLG